MWMFPMLNQARFLRFSIIGLFAGLALLPSTQAAVYVPEDGLWPNGVVPYRFDPGMDLASQIRVLIAFDIWEQVASVDFVEWTGEDNYVTVRNTPGGGGSSSEEGMQGGEQFLNIRQDLTGITDYGLAHEVGHLLAYYHTHQRPDRQTYITYYQGRVNDCGAGNYNIASDALAYPRNLMDYDSVMSYGECIFNICSRTLNEDCPCGSDDCKRYFFPTCNLSDSECCALSTIDCCDEDPESCRVLEIKDEGDRALFQAGMGQRDHLSEIDALVMSWLYPQPGWRFMELNYPDSDETGTFHHPYVGVQSMLDQAPQNITLWAQPAVYPRPSSVLTKPMTIKAARGSVLIR